MANESQTPTAWTQKKDEKQTFLSKIKWFFQKFKNAWWEQKNQHHTKSFHLTRRDSIISIIASLVVVGWAIYYWKIVLDDYSEINSRAFDELKNLEWYGINWWYSDKLWYTWSTVSSVISINSLIDETLAKEEAEKNSKKDYYEILLQNIYLPSLNIWKDPYTKNFNMSVLWQKYLESDKFQDLYLIQYWSDFVKYVWNDADYNTVDTITIWEKTVLEWNSNYFYIPITVSFSSPNKRSFLLLVNKLSMTSTQNNIALLNEFSFNLLEAIKDKKQELIQQLMEKYFDEFSSSSSWEFADNISDMAPEALPLYSGKVIWYELYHWVNGDLPDGTFQLIDEDVIEQAIKNSASCTKDVALNQECLYNFREKYRNLPYLAYKIWLENQKDRTKWLLEFLRDLPPVIAITNFGFEKYSDSSFLNNKEEEYKWEITFNAYGRNITDDELDEASSMLWKLCFWSATDKKINPDLALETVKNKIINPNEWEWDEWSYEYSTIASWLELQWLFTDIQESYNGMSNYNKMIKLFEVWRMMSDATLCSK